MAKKKKTTPRPRQLWCEDDLLELLAWLDYTLQHDDINFLATAVDHLKESRQKDFSLAQIQDKLRRQWTDYGSNDPSLAGLSWKDIYVRGSSCLALDPHEKEIIESILQNLEEGYNNIRLFNSRRLRSRSIPTNGGSNHLASSEYSGSPRKKTPIQLRQRTPTLSLPPSAIKREIETIEKESRPKSASKKRKRKTPGVKLTTSTNTEKISRAICDKSAAINEHLSRPTTPQRQLVIHDSEDEEAQRSKTITLVPQSTERFDASPCPNNVAPHEYNSGGTIELRYHDENASFVAEMADLKEQLRQQEAESRELRGDVATLQTEVEFLQSVQSQRDAKDGEPFYARIEGKDRIIKRLREELNDRRSLGTFTRILPTSQDGSRDDKGMTDVVTGFQKIYAECKQILYRYESSAAAIIPPLHQHEGLRSLIVRGLELDPHAPVDLEKMNIDLAKLSLQALVRALMTVALREWVFETNFPPFTEQVSDVLVKYREHLAKQDGARSLRRLDLAVQDSLIKDDHFRRTIPDKAEELAIRLSRDLAPLFPRNSEAIHNTSWDGFATWGQDSEEWKERRVRLVDIFKSAFELKADSVLNMLDYQMVMFPTQMKYDKNLMGAETMEGMIDYREHGSTIELCIEAAVYAYPRTELQDNAPISDAIVPYSNFVRKEAKQRGNMRPIVKAVVVLKEEALGNSKI